MLVKTHGGLLSQRDAGSPMHTKERESDERRRGGHLLSKHCGTLTKISEMFISVMEKSRALRTKPIHL